VATSLCSAAATASDSSYHGPEQKHHHPAAARFMSAAPVEQILAALEGAGLVVRELDDGSVNMEGTREGEHGALVVAVEIYELTPRLVVVEVQGKSGGAAEYEEFFRAIHACSPAASRHAHARTFIVDHRMWRSVSDSSWFAVGGARRRRWLPARPTWPRSFGSARPAPASSARNSAGAGFRTPSTGTWE
jgi:hypothetical protein